jgi:hypothetical protein
MDKSDARRVPESLKKELYPSSIRLPRCVIWHIKNNLVINKTINNTQAQVFLNAIFVLDRNENEDFKEWQDRISKLYKDKVQSSDD